MSVVQNDVESLQDVSLSGYDTDDRFYASRFTQGGRTVYSIDLSLMQIASLLPAPGPAELTEGNRRVRSSHATSFGEYIREHDDWVSPALILRAPDIFDFTLQAEVGGMQFGILAFSRLARADLRILDGQHRTLGIHTAIRRISTELEKKRGLLAAAQKNDEDSAVTEQIKAAINDLLRQRETFATERISVQVFVEDDIKGFHQMFYDIADNALGITGSVRARFDTRKIVNRAVEEVALHPLLVGRVDVEQDRISGANPNLLGAKHVAEIIRTVTVGIDGRIGRKLENELDESVLVDRSKDFLTALSEGFSGFQAIEQGIITPEGLRKNSLLGSTTMLRVLAGTYHGLTESGLTNDSIKTFFARLDPHMEAPIQPGRGRKKGSIWLKEGPPDVFTAGSMAPHARRQDLRALTSTLVEWAKDTPEWLDAEVETTQEELQIAA